jgi:hypothetical protein
MFFLTQVGNFKGACLSIKQWKLKSTSQKYIKIYKIDQKKKERIE